ncbi:hypothetical protein V1519DRAFT_450438 [Lipomyces tetrasporus]
MKPHLALLAGSLLPEALGYALTIATSHLSQIYSDYVVPEIRGVPNLPPPLKQLHVIRALTQMEALLTETSQDEVSSGSNTEFPLWQTITEPSDEEPDELLPAPVASMPIEITKFAIQFSSAYCRTGRDRL